MRARCAARTRSARLARAALPKTRFPKRARCVRRGLAFVRPIRCVRCGEAGNRGCDQAVFDYRDVRVSWPLVRFSVALRIGDLGASADQNHHTMFRSFASGLLPEGRLASLMVECCRFGRATHAWCSQERRFAGKDGRAVWPKETASCEGWIAPPRASLLPLAPAAGPRSPAAPPACPPRAPSPLPPPPPPRVPAPPACRPRGHPRSPLRRPPSRAAQPPSVRGNSRFLATKPRSGTPNAPLRPKRALLPGESPGRRFRQSRCAVGSGPVRARTRFGGQKSRAREHEGGGDVRRVDDFERPK